MHIAKGGTQVMDALPYTVPKEPEETRMGATLRIDSMGATDNSVRGTVHDGCDGCHTSH